MREILFRGKRLYNGEWVEGYYAAEPYTKNTYNCGYIFKNLFAKKAWLVDSRTIGQYTGLTDKNGKKIFEGDILEGIRYGNEERAEVLWIDKAASWGIRYSFREKNERGYPSWLNSAWFRSINDARATVVIGNIHDNPELLEVVE